MLFRANSKSHSQKEVGSFVPLKGQENRPPVPPHTKKSVLSSPQRGRENRPAVPLFEDICYFFYNDFTASAFLDAFDEEGDEEVFVFGIVSDEDAVFFSVFIFFGAF